MVRQARLLLILQSGTHPTRLSELAMSRATDGTALKRQPELGQTESVWWTLAVFGPDRPQRFGEFIAISGAAVPGYII